MTDYRTVLLTALAPAVWGSTYIVTTEFLPDGYPLTVAMLRALPAGVLLLLIVRQLPPVQWLGRIFVLGALNFAVFWSFLFIAAYRLPGGVAATVGAVQPLIVIFLAHGVLGSPIYGLSIVSAISGVAGVALLVLSPAAALDPVGIAAGVGGAVSMAAGTVLTRKWQPKVSLLTFTAWQLTAGGILLVPLAFLFEPALPALTAENVMGLTYLGLIGAALTYVLWFRGVIRLDPAAVSTLGFLSPASALLLGWAFAAETLSEPQIVGIIVVFVSIWLGQQAGRRTRPLHA